MTRYLPGCAAALVFLGSATAAYALMRRPPLLQGGDKYGDQFIFPEERVQRPEHLVKPAPVVPPSVTNTVILDEKSFQVQNRGNKKLVLKYWDSAAKGAWHDLEVAPLGSETKQCGDCKGTVSIAFHNGKKQVNYSLALPNVLTLDWSETDKVWKAEAAKPGSLAVEFASPP
jgi:hypothetical protein